MQVALRTGESRQLLKRIGTGRLLGEDEGLRLELLTGHRG